MEKKLYKCKYPDCTTEQSILSKGYCTYHRYKQRGSQVKQYRLKRETEKHKEKRKNKVEVMKHYWTYHLEQLAKGKNCENCGDRLSESVIHVAHILPKQNQIAVMDNLSNCLYLCSFCHIKYDRIQTTSQVYLMKVFPIALERYLTFREECKYNKYVEIFEKYIKENE